MNQNSPMRILGLTAIMCVFAWFFVLPQLSSTGHPTPAFYAFHRCLDYARLVQHSSTNGEYSLYSSLFKAGPASDSHERGTTLNLFFGAKELADKGENYLVKTN